VAIVGAGPVGQLLALLLARSGWDVQVFDQHEGPYDLPRAVHFDHEVARVLQGAGLMGELAPLTEVMDCYQWRNGAAEVLLSLEGGTGCSGWPASLMFCQADLERALSRHLAEMPNARLNWLWRADGVIDEPGGCRVTGTRADGERSSVLAKWVVASDGSNSTLRSVLQVPLDDFNYSFDWVVADVLPARPTRWSPLNVQVCDPSRPTTAVSGGPGRRRFEFLCLPGETLARMAQPGPIWDILRDWGLSASNATMERHAGYSFRSRLASQWQAGRAGRVFLAGDAAHQMPPFAGQGLCAGVRDVANLAWKLDLVLAGVAPESLLATYFSERYPVARAEVELSVGLGKLVCVLDSAEAAARDSAMVPAALETGPLPLPAPPALGPGVSQPGDPHAGELGFQGTVAYRGRRGLLDDVSGLRGWVMLSGAVPTALPAHLADWYQALGGNILHVGPGAAVDDVEGAYERWFAELGADVVLQRPDFRVFGTASGGGASERLVASAMHALARPVRPS